ncbi:unnamed protein product [Malus baccata var. baccata]
MVVKVKWQVVNGGGWRSVGAILHTKAASKYRREQLIPAATKLQKMKQQFGSLPAQKEEQAEGDRVLCAVSYDAVPLQAVPAPQLQVKFVPGENYGLPEGWAVEEKPRTTVKGRRRTDKYCHHIPTGKRFRSLSDANKWIKKETTREQAHGTSKDGDESSSPAQSSTRRIRRKATQFPDHMNNRWLETFLSAAAANLQNL